MNQQKCQIKIEDQHTWHLWYLRWMREKVYEHSVRHDFSKLFQIKFHSCKVYLWKMKAEGMTASFNIIFIFV